MKTKHYFMLGLGALMLGACNSDEIVATEGSGSVGEGTEGYVSFKVNLPQASKAMRAESFDDGKASEYAVKDATLLLFAGNSEADATFQSAYDLKTVGFEANGDNPNQITSSATITQKIDRPAGTNLYAMVVLNDNGLIEIDESGTTTFDNKQLDNQKTLAWFTTTVLTKDAAALTKNGFFMTNAPLATKQGGTQDPTGASIQTLAPIAADKIYTTAAEAGNNPAAVIYVERAVAKVTLNGNNGDIAEGGNSNVASYEISGWYLDNTNKKTYLVRNMTGVSAWLGYANVNATSEDKYRFVGGATVGNDISKQALYRTYFAVDPNFDSFTVGDFETIGGMTFDEANVTPLAAGSDGYCLENVFNVANMQEKSTTRVIVAAKLKRAGKENYEDFYTFNDNTNKLYDLAGVQNEVKRIALEWLDANKATWLTGTYEVTGENLTVNVPTDNGGYIQENITITFTKPNGAEFVEGKDATQLQNAMKAEVEQKATIGLYKGGVAYYPVLVKHFGDAQTPWTYSPGMIESYPGDDAAKKWLGRYGVLRNNWYQVNVTGVKNIGSPEVPTVTGRFDDPIDSYMSVEINVLSWAVRTQNVEL